MPLSLFPPCEAIGEREREMSVFPLYLKYLKSHRKLFHPRLSRVEACTLCLIVRATREHIYILRLDEFVHVLKEVQNRARAPGLCGTGVVAVRAILVRELGYPAPGIILDVSSNR